MNDAIAQVLAFGRSRKDAQLKAEPLLKVVADVLNDLLLGRGRKARNGNLALAAVKVFELFDEVGDEKIINAKVVAPDRKAVRLIDHKARHTTLLQSGQYRAGAKRLGGNVQKGGFAADHGFQRSGAFDRTQEPVDGDGATDAFGDEVFHLILHERLQGRNDDRERSGEFALHQSRQLKRDRLAAARGKDRQERFAAHGRTRGHFLQGFSVVGSKRVETEKRERAALTSRRSLQ